MKKNTGKFFQKNKKAILFFLPAVLIFLFDQLTKVLVKANFSIGESWTIIPNFLSLTYIQNTGAGFGLLRGFNALLIVVSVLVIGAIIYYYYKTKENETLLLLSMAGIFAGAFGNLVDRIAHGFVIDFIHFSFWPAFNLADMVISISVVVLVVYFWKKK